MDVCSLASTEITRNLVKRGSLVSGLVMLYTPV